MRFIEKIEISKFRSFGADEKIELLDLNVFSGGNDSGKSNVLKALNLFFNNQTDLNSLFNPVNDFNKWFRDNKERGQRNVKIRLTFAKGNFQDPNGINQGFIAEKEFRDDGGIDINYFHLNGTAIIKSEEDLSYRKANAVISEKIRFVYIPTVRDLKFRESVQRLIETLAISTDKRFKEQNLKLKNSFIQLEKDLSVQLTELKNKISSVMKIDVNANVNFSTLLESLSFETDSDIKINKRKGNSETQKIDLKSRGEGIQMQFFSFLLWFISKNDTKHNYIWGYEEPEIAFELKRQFELAEKFFQGDFLNDVQILLTTHSPAFAFLEENIKSKIYRVAFVQDKSTKRERKISKINQIKEYYDGLFIDVENTNNKNREYLEQDIWGINIQKISKIIGSSLNDVIKYRQFTDKEFEKIRTGLLEITNEKIALENKVGLLEKEISKTYPSRIFICEDEGLKSFWKKVLNEKCKLSNVEIYSSNGCQNNQIETAIKHLKTQKNSYNPIIFRQLDRDGYLDSQIKWLENKLNTKYKKFKSYEARYLPVNEMENFGYLIDSRFNSDSIKTNFEIYEKANDAFLKTINSNLLAIQRKFQESDDDKKIIWQEEEMKKEARKNYLNFYPGKEFKKLNIKFNPIKRIDETDFNDYPNELKSYLQLIIDFFNNGINTTTNTAS